jgi:Ca2+-binding EF-hand superfamily protein
MNTAALSSTGSSSYWEEFFKLSNSGKKRQTEDLSSSLFSELDTDGDGNISARESGLEQKAFDALDVNQDGSVSLEELGNALQLQHSAMLTRMQLEEDGAAGGIGQDFAPLLFAGPDAGAGGAPSGGETGRSVFDAMDTNQDGTISAEELAAALEKQKEAAGASSDATSSFGKVKELLLSSASKAYSAISQQYGMSRQIDSIA